MTEHARELEMLLARLEQAMDRIFDGAERVQEIVRAEETRLSEALGDTVLRADRTTRRRWRRLDQVTEYVNNAARDALRWQRFIYDAYAARPRGRWGRWNQRRRLRAGVRYLERAANHLETFRP